MGEDGSGSDESSELSGPDRSIEGDEGPGESSEEPRGDEFHPDDDSVCSTCGSQIEEDVKICPRCGAEQSVSESIDTGIPDKSRLTAALLAIALGIFGAHKFYLGNVKIGLLYLVLAPTTIPAIIGIIEGIIYLTKSEEEFQRQYVN